MRTTRDRISHTISFEIIALLTVTPLGAWAFDMPMKDIGVLAIAGATIAMAWNYVYNLMFDHALLRIAGDTRKTLATRIVHAILFEIGLLVAFIPFIAWYLAISWVQAFVMDVVFAAFFLVYAFVFNWAYDLIFPIPKPSRGSDSDARDHGVGLGSEDRARGSATRRI
ncbi:MAG: PACE efflux transporter [Proteobacteria bacterium]|nr:PACE efflux transporter [Pseudomonadota bacterium]